MNFCVVVVTSKIAPSSLSVRRWVANPKTRGITLFEVLVVLAFIAAIFVAIDCTPDPRINPACECAGVKELVARVLDLFA